MGIAFKVSKTFEGAICLKYCRGINMPEYECFKDKRL